MDRIEREKRVIAQMIEIYCRKHHGGVERHVEGYGREPMDGRQPGIELSSMDGREPGKELGTMDGRVPGGDRSEYGICDECRSLLEYAMRRLEHCPKGNAKTSCRKCEIHCYSAANRHKIRAVMRYVGPRMLFIHPLSALRHLLSELR